MTEKINNVSSAAVEKATGKSWDEWIRLIDKQGGAKMDHKGIVKVVSEELDNGWWQQMVTVGYEHKKGRRQTGETADAGYQIGVQRTIKAEQNALWNLLVSDNGLETWLGSVKSFSIEPGTRYKTKKGLSGEIRTVKPGERIRLTWKPKDRERSSTLQLTLSCPRNTKTKTTLRFHHEKLANTAEREQLRSHWTSVLDNIERLVTARKDSLLVTSL